MRAYEEQVYLEMQFWQQKIQKDPSFTDRVSKKVQDKINSLLPNNLHSVITVTIEKLVKAVLFGAKYTVGKSPCSEALQLQEAYIKKQISFYQKTASIEGAVTGAGGILMGLADFPILIGIKIKLLFEIAVLYGHNVKDYRERLYILYIFQLSFSSQQKRIEIYKLIKKWSEYSSSLPENKDEFDWRSFQQEYRDYIDLAKMAQLIPVIGTAVGAIANYKLIAQLGETAMNCYRMRRFDLRKTGY